MADLDEIERLSAGLPPARPEDAEIGRLERGERPPAVEEEVVATLSAAAVTGGSQWRKSTLDGSRVIRIGRAEFRIPRDAETKSSRRAGTIWVRIGSETYILSELGELVQSASERRSTRWDLL